MNTQHPAAEGAEIGTGTDPVRTAIGDPAGFLKEIGKAPDRPFDIGHAALALAMLDRWPGAAVGAMLDLLGLETPDQELARSAAQVCFTQFDVIDRAVAKRFRKSLDAGGIRPVDAAQRALAGVLSSAFRYAGDEVNYESLCNADFISVMSRRRGLPVALGILYTRTARQAGWDMVGIDVPAHFLVRLGVDGDTVILDPFHGGVARDLDEIAALVHRASGGTVSMSSKAMTPVSDRGILLRLLNNLLFRLFRRGKHGDAAGILERMLWIAPEQPSLWRQFGEVMLQLGQPQAGIAALERHLALIPEPGDIEADRIAQLVQSVRQQVN